MLSVTVIGFSGGIQSADSENTSLVVSDTRTSLLIDTSGSPVNALFRNGYDPLTIDAVILTHAHVDHLYAFPSLLHNLWLMKRTKPLIVLANSSTIEKAKELYRCFLLDKKNMMEIIWTSETKRIGSIDIETFPLFHRPKVPTNGFVFVSNDRKISYFPDNASTPPYPEVANHSDILIHEAGGLDKDRMLLREEGHSSGFQAAALAKELNAKKLLLVHLPANKQFRESIFFEAINIFPNTFLASKDYLYTT